MGDLEAKLFGAAMAAGVAAGAIVWSGSPLADQIRPDGVRLARMDACAADENLFTAEFAPVADVLSLTPMRVDLDRGEHGRVSVRTRRGATPSDRAEIGAFAAADGQVLAVTGDPASGFSVDIQPCDGLLVRYENIAKLSPRIAAIRDGVTEDRSISGGDRIGSGVGFDFLVADLRKAPRFERRLGVDAQRIAASAKCPLDFMPHDMKAEYRFKLGDDWGLRRARGEAACGGVETTAVSAKGVWKSAEREGYAMSLRDDPFDARRGVMQIGGEVSPIAHHMVELPRADLLTRIDIARSDFVFDRGEEDGLVNVFPVKGDTRVHCIEGLRSSDAGARLSAVALVSLTTSPEGADELSMEMRDEASRCSDLEQPWRFSAARLKYAR